MSRSQNQFNKKQKEKARLEKKKEKQQRKEDRKTNAPSGNQLEQMLAYVDENGNIVNSLPDKGAKKEIDISEIEVSTPKKVEEDPNQERRGRVSFFDISKGYGFINQDGTQERFFVHQSNLRVSINEGDKVSFVGRKGLKGPEAGEVRLIKKVSS